MLHDTPTSQTIEGTTFRGSPSGNIVKSSFSRQTLAPDEVAVRVTHSGVCGADLNYMGQDMVLGHEAIGIVSAVGSACKTFKSGDRVGWGYEHHSCGDCTPCLSGDEVYCSKGAFYGVSDLDQGSFSDIGVWKERWLFRIPDGIKSEEAAPLMCGGCSVFNPLIEHCRPIDRVGIVGLGGLGHLAVQFASKMGFDVVVFSRTPTKRDEALSLGANAFYTTDPEGISEFSSALGVSGSRPIDRLIITTSSFVDLARYLPVLAPKATIIPMTATKETLSVSLFDVLFSGVKIVPTMLSTRFMQTRMLEFAARNGIRPMIERFPMTEDGIERAMRQLKEGNIRYRAVLAWDYNEESK